MSQIVQDVILPSLATVVTVLIGIAMNWLRKKAANVQGVQEFSVYVEGLSARMADKWATDLKAAKDPNSPGGTEITTEEMSALRQKGYDSLMTDIKGPGKDVALKLGADVVKGLLGKAFNKYQAEKAA